MKNRNLWLSMLLVGMSLGTAWAIRGQFGHEQGAAWAGSIGCLSILLVAKRGDWFAKAFSATLAGAVGWGIGGMMSYGLVVGYGRGSDFGNVYYGLLMLFVIGGLYGFIGGGLFGLVLGNSKKNEVSWSKLIVEMVVGGLIFYFFMIEQFGWNMTPPRSELWAVCFGIAVALTAYFYRNKQFAPLRVAIFAGLGGGFGFAFGNFLQVLGQVSEIHFNFWNVMEYSLGFFGGLGMAYGTFTAKWEVNEEPQNNQLLPLIGVVFIIPAIVWQQSFEVERILEMLQKINVANIDFCLNVTLWFSLLLILGFSFYSISKYHFQKHLEITFSYQEIKIFFIGIFSIYIIFSWCITGSFLSTYRIEQYLYFVNFAIIIFLINKAEPPFKNVEMNIKKYFLSFLGVMVFLAFLAFVAINSHGELKGAKKRFGNIETAVSAE